MSGTKEKKKKKEKRKKKRDDYRSAPGLTTTCRGVLLFNPIGITMGEQIRMGKKRDERETRERRRQ